MAVERSDRPALRLRPFRAVRYSPASGDLGKLTAPPYDVISEAQRQELEARDPLNVVRLILPREPLAELAGASDGPQPHDAYENAATLFTQWLRDGVLESDDTAALYVYQQSRADRILQRGLIGAVHVEPLDGGVILPHETVRQGPVQDRLALMRATRTNPEPVFLLYDGGGAASQICARATATAPQLAFDSPDGIRHEVWRIDDAADLATIADDLAPRTALIADGHHRYTTYGYLRDAMREAGSTGEEWEYGLALLVDSSVAQPDLRAIHRVVPRLTYATALARSAAVFQTTPLDLPAVGLDGCLDRLAENAETAFVITDGTRAALLTKPAGPALAQAKPAQRTEPWWRLDAAIAAELLLRQVWGVADEVGELEAEHDPATAVERARTSAGVALLLRPARLADVVAVAQVGDTMPRKSTLFGPKPRSGILLRWLDLEA